MCCVCAPTVGTCLYLEAKGRVGAAPALPAPAASAAASPGVGVYEQVSAEMGDMLLPFYADMSQPICQHFL